MEERNNSKLLLKENERIDDLARNGYVIIQNPNKFCFGMDAVLLSDFVHTRPGDTVLDMGTGNGIIPILLAARQDCGAITGLEIQPDSADMARRSVAINNLSSQISIVTGDIKEAGKLFAPASFDCITCNPPYMIGQHGLQNPEEPKAIARHEICCTLDDVLEQAARLLRVGGHFFMVHRPFRLAEIISKMTALKLEPKRMQLVYPYVDKEPNMVLIEGKRGGKSRLQVMEPYIVYERPGVYTGQVHKTYGEE